MKKYIALLMIFFMVVSISPTIVCAEETCALTKSDILAMGKSELLLTLKDNGLVLPEDYAAHIELAEAFVFKYTPIIIEGSSDLSDKMFNYNQSNELLSNLVGVLTGLGLVSKVAPLTRSTYTLLDNTVIGTWKNSYQNYNRYAYALGKTSWLIPGDTSGGYFSLSMSIEDMADLVLADLATEGYWGYTSTTKPSSLPDEYFRIIAIRKDTSCFDFHVMRFNNGSLSSWVHKPGGTHPLKWKYTSPSAKVWSNEYVFQGKAYPADTTYESSVYYILYKHENDPGIQPWSIMGEIEDS